MKLYKLTDSNGYTYIRSMKWEIGSEHKITFCRHPKLCSSGVIHAYRNLNLAFLLNSIHAAYINPKVFLGEGDVVVSDYGKVGVFSLKILKEINPPEWVYNKKENLVRVQFAVQCAQIVLPLFTKKYPNNNRPRKAIEVALDYLRHSTSAINDDATNTAQHYAKRTANYVKAAASAAAYAASAAAYAAYAASAAAQNSKAANSEAIVANDSAAAAAASAAAAAASAASAAAQMKKINFEKLANRAVKMIMSPKKTTHDNQPSN